MQPGHSTSRIFFCCVVFFLKTSLDEVVHQLAAANDSRSHCPKFGESQS